jgi:ABC-type cobalamin/Fe3+-siderophores transport system ATPase subunit
LATLVAQEASVVLLDEPANHLDPAQQFETHRFIGELWRSGLGVLLVSHDVNLPTVLDPAQGSRVVGLARGRIVFVERAGAPELPGRLSELYGVEFQALDASGRRVLVASGGRGVAS